MNGFGDDKMKIGQGWKDGNYMICKEYSAPNYMLFKRRCYKGWDRMEYLVNKRTRVIDGS